ncbi:hypothetical protein QUF74_08425 [Candidatus Halobeggiatoa sp. HSG11]|nr:hypothetical protein [Candidatus Halobeggiatoa sp. HSG11]
MKTIQMISHADEKGMLHIQVPKDMQKKDIEILLVLQPINEPDPTEELMAIDGLTDAIEQSRQRVNSSQFTNFEDIKRDV